MDTVMAVWFVVMSYTATGEVVTVETASSYDHCMHMVALFEEQDKKKYNRYDFVCKYQWVKGVLI